MAIASPTRPGRADVRSGDRWTRPQAAKNWLIRACVRGSVALADRVPARLLLLAARLAGAALHRLSPALRAVAERNLVQAFPGIDARGVSREVFRNAGENLGRTLLLRRRTFRATAHVHIDGATRRVFDETLARGAGVVFVSAHLGPFEWLAAAIAELGLCPAVVVRESYDPALDPIVDRHRTLRGIEVIHRGRPGAAFRIVRALRSGRPVGFLPDLGGRVAAKPVRFLGHESELPLGPELIAVRTGAPILVGTLRPRAEPGHFELRLERLETSEPNLTQRVADALSAAIASSKEHWLWMARALATPDYTRVRVRRAHDRLRSE
jgi:KDO2-lipid IV(A) lauroyltransferase